MSSSENTGATSRWLRRIADSISGEPRDREQLAEVLRDARERGLIDSDALRMLEACCRCPTSRCATSWCRARRWS